MKHTLSFCFSIILFFWIGTDVAIAQDDTEQETSSDSITVKEKYGLRFGVDTSKLIRTFLDDEYTGFEVVADYRLTKKLYIAGELGNETKDNITDFLDVTTTGSYLRAGIDYNLYQNWLDMDNMVYFGFRVGASTFNHTINSFNVYSTNQYWEPQFTSEGEIKKDGLSAIWSELVIGIKAELFNNLYMGLNVQLKALISETIPENFENIYIPGYQKTYDSSRLGSGYAYTLTYRLPLYKKDKVIVPIE
ncbi:DUF6048 family protein [Hyunsoonleella aquatilis]|nr:DUF6048 family protein [Hyunsoonleella aquatilis]